MAKKGPRAAPNYPHLKYIVNALGESEVKIKGIARFFRRLIIFSFAISTYMYNALGGPRNEVRLVKRRNFSFPILFFPVRTSSRLGFKNGQCDPVFLCANRGLCIVQYKIHTYIQFKVVFNLLPF